MVTSFFITFFRFTVLFVFALSSYGKLRDAKTFAKTITKFNIFPSSFSNFLAYLFLFGEFSVIISMVIGRYLLQLGFILATIMFFSFSVGLTNVVVRRIKTSCNCFGPDTSLVGPSHIIRSLGLMLCSLAGFFCNLLSYRMSSPLYLDFFSTILPGLAASFFVTIWIHLSDVFQIFFNLEHT